ncbi:hypothetical protein Dsin_015546 [Dipteronia sinensis]|uniref:Uncharacterized protein n=1 Tax=Dipteronia sinensis TaxID=43782 RepID=A0AAE0ABG3_9ROSI|nr:hypothetical protein Dsin_015546 [Dipteronia sinensis]
MTPYSLFITKKKINKETTKLRYNNINNNDNLNDTSILFNRTRFFTLADLR